MEARADCDRSCEPSSGPIGCRQQANCLFVEEVARLTTTKVRFLRSRGLDEFTAEEIVDRAVLKLLQVQTPIRHLAAYFHTMVVREHINIIRELEQRRRFAPLFAEDDVDEGTVHGFVEYQERLATLRALKGISELAVTLAELRWVHGWTTDDLISSTGMSKDAIDQHISRVRRAARRARERGEF